MKRLALAFLFVLSLCFPAYARGHMSGGHISVHREVVALTLLLLALLGFAIKARYDLAQRAKQDRKELHR